MLVLFLPSAATVFLLSARKQPQITLEQDNSHFLIRYVYRFSCLLIHPNMVYDVEICVKFGQIKKRDQELDRVAHDRISLT